jgi:hypothetical protein
VCESNVSRGVRTSVATSTIPKEPVDVAEALTFPTTFILPVKSKGPTIETEPEVVKEPLTLKDELTIKDPVILGFNCLLSIKAIIYIRFLTTPSPINF